MPWGIVGGAIIGAVATNKASGKAADAQNRATEAASESADAAAQLGQDQLQFSKDQWAELKPYRDKSSEISLAAAEAQLASQKQNDALAADYADYNKSTFRPLEQKIVDGSQSYDTAGRRAQASNEALASVEGNFARSQDGLNRSMQRMGVTPGSGRSMALMQDLAIEKAKAGTAATSSAIKGVETTGWARMSDAANLGRNLPSSQATSAGLALSAGSQASASGTSALNSQSAGSGLVSQGYAGAMQGMSTAGNLYSQAASQYGNIAGAGASAWGSIGSAAGRLIGMYPTTTGAGSLYNTNPSSVGAVNGSDAGFYISDEEKKTGTGKPIDTRRALAEVVATPVDEGWTYDPAKGGPDDGGQPHDGPMAQDVLATMGGAVAPGGKQIDLVSMNGKLMAGMQELNRKVDTLAKRVSKVRPMAQMAEVAA